MQSLIILGRQPALGLAELESLYSATSLRPVGNKAVLLNVDPCLLAFDRLGGSVKFCKVLTSLDTTNWSQIEKFLLKVSPEHSQKMVEGKMQLGLSAIGLKLSPEQLKVSGLALKKSIRKTGRNVRLIPNKELELNTAQVSHNHLTGPTGWELIFVRDGVKTMIAQTIKVQDISSYTLRDRGRPKRDTRVGMLPPKLAQIIINLAVGKLSEDILQSICEIPAGMKVPQPRINQTILDPFCGTGVVLQEALLMGYAAYGSDLEPRMISYSRINLDWLTYDSLSGNTSFSLTDADATTYTWQQGVGPLFDFVASETYLGRPFTSTPIPEVLSQTVVDCNLIIKKFLRNIHSQVRSGTRFCLAVPAWQLSPGKFKHLPLLDHLEDLGYNRVSFEHVRDEELVYFRPGQIVTRQLLVITRK